MPTNRLEAFSDGVLAIIITIMVLELRAPEEPTFEALGSSATSVLTYLLSFVYIGIYWNNHHHLFHVVDRVTGGVLWSNLHLLFWLSLLPFTTAWMDESALATPPTVVYGANLLLCAIAWYVMQTVILRGADETHRLRAALGSDLKGKLSPFIYLAGILLSFVTGWLGVALYSVVACLWLVPDRRLERFAGAGGTAAD